MTIEYQYDDSDYSALAAEQRRAFPHSWSYIYYNGILPILAVGLAIAVNSFVIAAIFTALFLGTSWFIQHRVDTIGRQKMTSEARARGPWRVTLGEEGIRFSASMVETIYRWSSIRRVVRGPRFIAIETNPSKGIQIPLRVFGGETQIQQFIATAQTYIKK